MTMVDFDGDVSLAEKEAVVLSTAMKILTTVDFGTHVKNTDLELVPINLKEGDRYVVNHGEGLTAVDFSENYKVMKVRAATGEEEGAAVRRLTKSDCGSGERGRVVVMKANCEGWENNVGSSYSSGRGGRKWRGCQQRQRWQGHAAVAPVVSDREW
ncbi:hypothetical protein BHM03_00038176 [Ensete ventricosum]|nr:hypothetical protein BHM03_00038176 [Ensete ventricosum]